MQAGEEVTERARELVPLKKNRAEVARLATALHLFWGDFGCVGKHVFLEAAKIYGEV